MQSLPAAHIKGRGQVWEKKNGVYTPQWDCEDSGTAFVTGGMRFQHSDNSLYVPTCGWYYVTSQITFKSSSRRPKTFRHTLKIDRNCSETNLPYSHTGLTTTGPLEHDITVKSSTFVGDLVKICTGGRIYVDVPDDNSCCPLGEESMTLLTAYLVKESECQWPLLSPQDEIPHNGTLPDETTEETPREQ